MYLCPLATSFVCWLLQYISSAHARPVTIHQITCSRVVAECRHEQEAKPHLPFQRPPRRGVRVLDPLFFSQWQVRSSKSDHPGSHLLTMTRIRILGNNHILPVLRSAHRRRGANARQLDQTQLHAWASETIMLYSFSFLIPSQSRLFSFPNRLGLVRR